MCLALPVQVIQCLPENRGVINLAGVHREISFALVPDVEVGDYVIMHVGYALAKLDQAEAEKNIALFNEMFSEAP
jgi:hydrogenase expression/formation protein HypC